MEEGQIVLAICKVHACLFSKIGPPKVFDRAAISSYIHVPRISIANVFFMASAVNLVIVSPKNKYLNLFFWQLVHSQGDFGKHRSL